MNGQSAETFQTSVEAVKLLLAEPDRERLETALKGFEFFEGRLFESRGQYGESGVSEINPSNGELIRWLPLENQFFGEGLTVVGDTLIQLTWRNGVANVIDPLGGSYYVVSGVYNFNIFLLSLPFSLLSSLLLLSNELRDYEQDLAQGIKTMSVRLGFKFSVRAYYTLSALTYLVSVLLFFAGMLDSIALILISALALYQPLKLLNADKNKRLVLTALTGRLYFAYGFTYLTTIWMSQL